MEPEGANFQAAEKRVRPFTAADLEAMTEVHMLAFPGYRSTLLGPSFVRRLYGWFLEHPNGFGSVVLDSEDALLGFVVGTKTGSGPAITRYLLKDAASGLLRRPSLLFQSEIGLGIGRKIRQFLQPRPAEAALPGDEGMPTATLMGIAVAPNRRGAGVGSLLMRTFESDAVERGYERLLLSVRPENESACRLYQRCGWEEVAALRSPSSRTYLKFRAAGSDR